MGCTRPGDAKQPRQGRAVQTPAQIFASQLVRTEQLYLLTLNASFTPLSLSPVPLGPEGQETEPQHCAAQPGDVVAGSSVPQFPQLVLPFPTAQAGGLVLKNTAEHTAFAAQGFQRH